MCGYIAYKHRVLDSQSTRLTPQIHQNGNAVAMADLEGSGNTYPSGLGFTVTFDGSTPMDDVAIDFASSVTVITSVECRGVEADAIRDREHKAQSGHSCGRRSAVLPSSLHADCALRRSSNCQCVHSSHGSHLTVGGNSTRQT